MRASFRSAGLLRAAGALALLATGVACHRGVPPRTSIQPPGPSSPTPPRDEPGGEAVAPLPAFAAAPLSTHEGDAVWYDVPEGSLPQRRAAPGAMTAASDALPVETYVRVTRLENGKSVIVRITDTGLHKSGAIIDLDRAAAETLEMVKAGKAKVKVEVLAVRADATPGPAPRRAAPTASSK